MHISVKSTKRYYDDASAWDLMPRDFRPMLRKGDRGGFVTELQLALAISADGVFGSGTETAVKQFQRNHAMQSDGIVGLATWSALPVPPPKPERPDSDDPNKRPTLRRGSKGEHVGRVQAALAIVVDNDFDPIMEAAVRAFQHEGNLVSDGIVGH
jgi:peptidoglycan hydrolase-like protein with peptidoglycan-binding domain